jgi:putative two-component system response regulator
VARSRHQATIMVVDDQPANLRLMEEILSRHGYSVRSFPGGRLALQAADANPPDLILLDITMPGMDGFEVCRRLQANAKLSSIPVIFLSALSDTEDKLTAFRSGGLDYLTKPFAPEEIQARIQTQLRLRELQSTVERQNRHLKELVEQQVREIAAGQMATIFALAKLADSRDNDTGAHLERVQVLCRILASEMSGHLKYRDTINDEYVNNIFYASPLHDIGKVSIPDSILLKEGKLTNEEYAVMKTHTTRGAETLELVREKYPCNGFISMGIDIARSHHERWDGRGYPNQLSGEEIPLSARIMAIADCYDALRSKRSYKPAYTHEETRDLIVRESGTQFDPEVVSVFLGTERTFKEVSERIS